MNTTSLGHSKTNLVPVIAWDIATLVLPLIGTLPLMVMGIKRFYESSYGLFFPLAWLLLLVMILVSKRGFATQLWRHWLGAGCLVVALVIGLVAVGKFRPDFAQVALAFCFVGWGSVRLSFDSWTRVVAMSMLIFSTVPLPARANKFFSELGNAFVANTTGPVLDLFKIFHLYELPNLKIRDYTFNLLELLNNPISVQLMMVLAVAVALLRRRSLSVGVMTCLSAGLWTLIGRFFLVIVLASVGTNGLDLTASPTYYNLLLTAVGFFSAFMVLVSDLFWNSVLSPIRVGEDNSAFRSVSANVFNSIVEWPLAPDASESNLEDVSEVPIAPKTAFSLPMLIGAPLVVAMAFIAGVFGTAYLNKNDLLSSGKFITLRTAQLPEDRTLPEDFILGQPIRSFRSTDQSGLTIQQGWVSAWQFLGTAGASDIRFRFPVNGWTDTFAMEESQQNWTQSKCELQNNESKWPWSESTLKNAAGNNAVKWTCQVLLDGSPYVPSEQEFNEAVNPTESDSSLFDFPAFANPFASKNDAAKPWSAQIIMIYTVEGEIREPERQRMLAKFFEARDRLRNRMVTGSNETPTPEPKL